MTEQQDGWRAGMQYAADIAEELCICGGTKSFHAAMADIIAEIEKCLAGDIFCEPRKYLPPHEH